MQVAGTSTASVRLSSYRDRLLTSGPNFGVRLSQAGRPNIAAGKVRSSRKSAIRRVSIGNLAAFAFEPRL